MSYYLYKGLKKPLVLFGLKDKYIYQAFGFMFLGLVSVAVFNAFLGIIGVLIGAGIGGGGVWWCFKRQDTKGLYNKTKSKDEVFIFNKNIIDKKL